MKLCLIYNFAQHYRKGIFKLIDTTYKCDFVFGDSLLDIKKVDYNIFNGNVREVRNLNFMGLGFQKGVLSLLWRDYDGYIILGETKVISTWLFLLLAKFFPKKKVVMWTHGWYGKETPFEKIVKKVFLRLPTRIMLYGNWARQQMIDEGFNPDKLFVIHNSLDYDEQLKIRASLSKNGTYLSHFIEIGTVLLFIGRLTKVKRLDMLIDAVKMCNEKGELCNLVFVGDGQECDFLKDKVTKDRLSENVWFYGACYDEREIGNLIYNADICVSPGNVGLTAMHSLVFGTPVITHDNFSLQMPEFEAIKSGTTGDFFKYGDVNSLCECIINWIHSGRDREMIRRACMEEIDKNWTPAYQLNVIDKALS